MTSYLAPESPRPFAVAAENYFQQINPLTGFTLAADRSYQNNSSPFGDQYEKEFSFYLAKHAEVNCSDRLCLITEQSHWATIIQERLFLNKPVYFIDSKLHQDAIEEQLVNQKFDRIILLNCLHQLNQPAPTPSDSRPKSGSSYSSANTRLLKFFARLRQLLTNQGKIVLVHREPNINTLPLPIEVITHWYESDGHSARLIEQLHRDRKKDLELLWEVETVKFTIPKLVWFNLLIHRTFYPLTLLSSRQIADGLRQLNETYFKYHQGYVEMYDRLLFLTMQQKPETKLVISSSVRLSPVVSTSKTISNRSGKISSTPKPKEQASHEMWNYQMLVTDEINQLLDLQSDRQNKKRDLFKSSLDFM